MQQKSGDSEQWAATGAALQTNPEAYRPDLAEVVAAWSELPEAIKSGILAMIRASVNPI